MSAMPKPLRWQHADDAHHSVQVAFDVDQSVLDAVRCAAFENHLSTSDQIRRMLELPTPTRPKRPRLTVSLTAADYALLGKRYGVASEDRLTIKEHVTQELARFAGQGTHQKR
nr:hypothetical protein [uncultured Caldimonas sp.]